MSYPAAIVILQELLVQGAIMSATKAGPSAAAVAAEVRRRRKGTGKVKLHKLLYYVQGYHLAWEGRPAFVEEIEAWEMGPVVARLWRDERYRDHVATGESLPETVRNTVTNVLCRFGHMTGKELIDATHAEDPWCRATGNGRFVSNQVISHRSLIDFFSRESPELRRMREALALVRDESRFVPDPPGALAGLMSEYSAR